MSTTVAIEYVLSCELVYLLDAVEHNVYNLYSSLILKEFSNIASI